MNLPIDFPVDFPAYDPTNVFARILRGEIPCQKVHETPHALAFHDAYPDAPIHVLVIPKGPYLDFHHFSQKASSEEILDFHQAASTVITQLGLHKTGYRTISNMGKDGRQEVFHFHLHVLGGAPL